MATVTTPVEGFSGNVIGINFVDGTADVEGEGQLAYFARHGYQVGHAPEQEAPAEKPFSQLNKGELTELATAEEIDISAATTNDEIRAAIKAARDAK